MPALYRSPIVGQQMHRTVRADRVDRRSQVLGKLVEPVGVAAARLSGLAGSPDVIADDVVARRQFGRNAIHRV